MRANRRILMSVNYTRFTLKNVYILNTTYVRLNRSLIITAIFRRKVRWICPWRLPVFDNICFFLSPSNIFINNLFEYFNEWNFFSTIFQQIWISQSAIKILIIAYFIFVIKFCGERIFTTFVFYNVDLNYFYPVLSNWIFYIHFLKTVRVTTIWENWRLKNLSPVIFFWRGTFFCCQFWQRYFHYVYEYVFRNILFFCYPHIFLEIAIHNFFLVSSIFKFCYYANPSTYFKICH